MLYQPSYMYPYLSDIDATKENTFYCYINAEGNTTVNAYNLTINDLAGNKIYTSGQQTISTPLYSQQVLYINVPTNATTGMVNGIDYVWNIQLYETQSDIWVAFGSIQEGVNTTTTLYLRRNYLVKSGDWISINAQKVKIKTYNAETGVAQLETALTSAPLIGTTYNIYTNNVTSNDYLFYARSEASLSIDNIPPTSIHTKGYTFTATYTQAQGVGYKYFIWTLYDEDGGVLDTTGKVLSGAITYTFDGFLSDEIYGVGLELQTQDDAIINTGIKYFNVKYASPEASMVPTVTTNCDKDAIQVSWEPLYLNQGVATGTYEYVTDVPYTKGVSVTLPEESQIYWNIGSSTSPIYMDSDNIAYINWSPNTIDLEVDTVVYLETSDFVMLDGVGATLPSEATDGDVYYNTTDNLIYTMRSDNKWQKSEPLLGVIYKDTTNKYIYDGTKLTTTKYDAPRRELSVLSSNTFLYNITEGGYYIQDTWGVEESQSFWLLRGMDDEYTTLYQWEDDSSWDDKALWMEKTPAFNNLWFKIALLPPQSSITIGDRTSRIYVKTLRKRTAAWNGDATGLTHIYYNKTLYKIADFVDLGHKPNLQYIEQTVNGVPQVYSVEGSWLTPTAFKGVEAYIFTPTESLFAMDYIFFLRKPITYYGTTYPAGVYVGYNTKLVPERYGWKYYEGYYSGIMYN